MQKYVIDHEYCLAHKTFPEIKKLISVDMSLENTVDPENGCN